MIHFITGDIFESDADALVNTVNLVGVMGKGVALQFKKRFPRNYKLYQIACKERTIDIGKLFVTEEEDVFGKRIIINFPTKTDWRKSSEYCYVEKGLDDLVRVITQYGIKSVALPPLGAGNGGLNWEKVKQIIVDKLQFSNVDFYVYEPNSIIREQLKKERVKLTRARALMLYLLYDLVRHGEFVSEFSSEKICYFLQKFGGRNLFNLDYEARYYGPYSGKVKYVLNVLNGSYVMGYSDMNKKPFDNISLVADGYPDVKSMIDNDKELGEIAEKTSRFLDGFYSDFGLELLSSVDYLITKYGGMSIDEIHQHLSEWNHRKSIIFSDSKYIKIAKEHIENFS
jgi:O-acetyl-ADP-ribose deacetylase (regulator of RNase III)